LSKKPDISMEKITVKLNPKMVKFFFVKVMQSFVCALNEG